MAKSHCVLGRIVNRWVHYETRNPLCWGPRSGHEPSPLGDGRAVGGLAGKVSRVACKGIGKLLGLAGWGGTRGSQMCRLIRDGNVGPCLCGVSSQFVCEGRSTRGRRFRILRGLRSLFLIVTGLRLAPFSSGAVADGGSASPIRFRLLVSHGSVARA